MYLQTAGNVVVNSYTRPCSPVSTAFVIERFVHINCEIRNLQTIEVIDLIYMNSSDWFRKTIPLKSSFLLVNRAGTVESTCISNK
jgi:hypothetical protein